MSDAKTLLNKVRQQIADADAAIETAKKPAHRGGVPGSPAEVPFATTGAVGQDSRPFSLVKALVNGVKHGNWEDSKLEHEVMQRFRKGLKASGAMLANADTNAYWLPTSFADLGADANQNDDVKYVKAVYEQSAVSYDPDEARYLKARYYKTQSAYADTLGGTLVQPPTQGPVIPLIRPQAALLAAGAQSFPLPPQGRHVRPRITGAPSVQAVAESQDPPETNLTTDQMELSARKMAGLCRVPEEAMAFTSGTIETLARQELERSLGLKMDAYGFYGAGGPSIPNGVLSPAYSSAVINVETSYPAGRGIGTNGNTLRPEYGDLLPSLIEERSFNQDAGSGAWVMRPGAFASAMGVRATGPVPGDNAGPLVDLLRRFGESAPQQWRGRKVVVTTNVSGTRTKGSGTNLSDAFYGIWQHCVVATYGAIAFTQGHDANSFARGQFLIRGVMYGDIGFEYPSAFLVYRDLLGVQDQI